MKFLTWTCSFSSFVPSCGYGGLRTVRNEFITRAPICMLLWHQRAFEGCHCVRLPFNHQPISFCPEHPQAYVIQRMRKPYETTSNRRGVPCPGTPAAPTEWNMLKHFLRKSGESNQASSTSQLCASSVFLVLLVNKITNTDCLNFKNCMCKSMLCLYQSIHVDADVVL